MDEETTRGYEVVYREAIRALDLQRNAFDTLRARVGFLLSADKVADMAAKPEPRGGTNPMRPYPGDEKRPRPK